MALTPDLITDSIIVGWGSVHLISAVELLQKSSVLRIFTCRKNGRNFEGAEKWTELNSTLKAAGHLLVPSNYFLIVIYQSHLSHLPHLLQQLQMWTLPVHQLKLFLRFPAFSHMDELRLNFDLLLIAHKIF